MSAQLSYAVSVDWRENERFKKVYPHVFAVEGGYVWDKRDSGGATNHGISFNNNQGYLKRYGITRPEQMINLTKDQALEIYYRKYWIPSLADEINDIRLAMVYFDHVVNAGQGAADPLLNKLDKRHWYIAGDGPNRDYFWGLTTEYMLHRLWWYAHIRQWSTYGLGWFNRLIKIAKALPSVTG